MRLQYVEQFKDRHGKDRYYFRRGHGERTTLPGLPGSQEFMEVYRAALAQAFEPVRTANHKPGSFAALADLYFNSPDFLRLKDISKQGTRNNIERFLEGHGHRYVADMSREAVNRLIGEKAATPAAANTLLKRLRTLIRFAIVNGWRKDDPTIGIRKFREGEYHSWTDAEIEQFEAHWALGTIQRTAFALHLYTGQRRDDVRQMTWNDAEGGVVRVCQTKTGARLVIPQHKLLKDALEAWPRKHVTILVGPRGKPYTVESYGNWMADAIDGAGLPKRCVLHGVRKAAARRLAECGCSANEIAAVTGHKSLSEVERYTRAAAQEKLAGAAILSLPGSLGKV